MSRVPRFIKYCKECPCYDRQKWEHGDQHVCNFTQKKIDLHSNTETPLSFPVDCPLNFNVIELHRI